MKNNINYNKASSTYDNTRSHSDTLISRFAERVSFSGSTTIVDFGCGTGNYLNRIQQLFGSICCGIEPSYGMRAIAHEKNLLLDIREGDHSNIPFENETFDFAFMTDVIHHVPDIGLMFSVIWRVLKFEGILCIVTESHDQIQARFYNSYFPSLYANEIKRYPTIESISGEAIINGFIHEDTEVLPASGPEYITAQFIRNVEEKNYSMFRLLDEEEYTKGLSRLKADIGRQFYHSDRGESLIWLKKTANLLK